MAVTTPDWLRKRNGEVRPATVDNAWLVLLAGEPQYRLAPVPARGRHSVQVTQTNNGQRLDKGDTYPTLEDALKGGLEELRQALGW
ncbi:MAG TPA: hypothetical protein VGY58_12035 [Gemmataceae bacterium]|jgi:hypothetical protein|nr:hypothetical protein [Gemmataceae bacterium]